MSTERHDPGPRPKPKTCAEENEPVISAADAEMIANIKALSTIWASRRASVQSREAVAAAKVVDLAAFRRARP